VIGTVDEVAAAFAKLAGVRKALTVLLASTDGGARPQNTFWPKDVNQYFYTVNWQLPVLQRNLPELYRDFQATDTSPAIEMAPGGQAPRAYSRAQLHALARDIDQVFEIRAHSTLSQPTVVEKPAARVFISHGRANDWREVQAFIERDIPLPTLELAQEPNLGRTVLQKLEGEASRCTSAVIVMTADDMAGDGSPRARENVIHEIGYFQAKYGLAHVCLLHEEGTNIPSNIHGLVYIPFPKGYVSATFGALGRELKALYKLG